VYKSFEEIVMEKMIAVCGLDCSTCSAFIATKNNDEEAKAKIARQWSTPEFQLKPEDINCDGCVSQGARLASFCKECGIRNCCMEKGIENCAYCDLYRCEMLINSHNRSPQAQKTLDGIRENLK
jgi:hypothetical protein